jgi:hypothetical protein
VGTFERGEQREVGKPGNLAGTEGLEGLARLGPRVPLERGVGLGEHGPLELDERAEVDLAPGKAFSRFQVVVVEQAVVAQAGEADQEGVSRKGGEALVGRVALARGPQRKHLPEALPRLHQEIEKRHRFSPQLADAVGTG